MSGKSTPQKLKARLVREHVARIARDLRRLRVDRDAASCDDIYEISWRSLDLYTIALDESDDARLRFLVGQARGMIAAELMRSACR